MDKFGRPPVKLMSYPKLDFSGIRLEGSAEEYEQIRREVAEWSSKDAMLKRIAHIREHPECVRAWECPITIEEYVSKLALAFRPARIGAYFYTPWFR